HRAYRCGNCAIRYHSLKSFACSRIIRKVPKLHGTCFSYLQVGECQHVIRKKRCEHSLS
ncbi:hypothetical protein COCCADRAFT_103822, partial [Bipolaris zeicola 26-R-13]